MPSSYSLRRLRAVAGWSARAIIMEPADPTTPALPAADGGGGSAADALASAVAFLRDSRCTHGSHEGGGSDWEVASHQWGLFISWAYNRGVALPADFSPSQPGGREHDLLFDETTRRWLKFTRPFAAGDTVVLEAGRLVRRPATPWQYLRRWQLCNRFLADDVRLVGLSCLGRTQRIVVSQRHRPGRLPTWDEVDGALIHVHRMRRLPDAILPPDGREGGTIETRGYFRGRLAVFDVRPDNFVRTPEGAVVPFDILPQIFGAEEAMTLRQLAK